MTLYIYMCVYFAMLHTWNATSVLLDVEFPKNGSRRPKQGIVGFPLCKHIHYYTFMIVEYCAHTNCIHSPTKKKPLKTVQ